MSYTLNVWCFSCQEGCSGIRVVLGIRSTVGIRFFLPLPLSLSLSFLLILRPGGQWLILTHVQDFIFVCAQYLPYVQSSWLRPTLMYEYYTA
jgi:hypothetical protein